MSWPKSNQGHVQSAEELPLNSRLLSNYNKAHVKLRRQILLQCPDPQCWALTCNCNGFELTLVWSFFFFSPLNCWLPTPLSLRNKPATIKELREKISNTGVKRNRSASHQRGCSDNCIRCAEIYFTTFHLHHTQTYSAILPPCKRVWIKSNRGGGLPPGGLLHPGCNGLVWQKQMFLTFWSHKLRISWIFSTRWRNTLIFTLLLRMHYIIRVCTGISANLSFGLFLARLQPVKK